MSYGIQRAVHSFGVGMKIVVSLIDGRIRRFQK
jgi:hypothetical protein